MFKLRFQTPDEWTCAVQADFDRFLIDHASAEKKASGMALSMALHYPDKPELVSAMLDLAVEEMDHFRCVVRIMTRRQLRLRKDDRDHYVNALRQHARHPSEEYFLDRLLLGAVIEARGAERFGLVAAALAGGELADFYRDIASSEVRHQQLFLELAQRYFPAEPIATRLDQLLEIEAALASELRHRPALH